MSSARVLRRLLAAAFPLLMLLLAAAPVLAHEGREIAGYEVEVGFMNEPAFVGGRSGLEIVVNKEEAPVEGLEASLKAEVIVGGQRRDLPLTTREGEPGAYESVFIPTVAGPYTFHLTGTIEDAAIDESFTSSPTGFNEVQEATALQFPIQLPSAAELQASARKGEDAAGLVMPALVLGVAGLVAGLLAVGLMLANRRTQA